MLRLYEKILRAILFKFPAETAHEIGVKALKVGLGSRFAQNSVKKRFSCNELGSIERFGLEFRNPFGVAAGFDKNGILVNQLGSIGFGFVEVGTVTYEAQSGNEKPRLFRLSEDGALINRLGFNNEGVLKIIERLKGKRRNCILGLNIGKNKNVSDGNIIKNYLKSFEIAYEVADYIAVNVSSPNTPGLCELQKSEILEELLGSLQDRNRKLSADKKSLKPILLKISPDLLEKEIEKIVDTAIRLEISGIIATNTTINRKDLKTSRDIIDKVGYGGLSGRPIAKRSNDVILKIYTYSRGKLPIIGVGGIFTAKDAFEKIASGASLLQAYTGFIYNGITFARDINLGLASILREKGFKSINQAIGSIVK